MTTRLGSAVGGTRSPTMRAMSTSPGRVGVLFGGPSPEHDVSILTGLQAARTLARSGRAGDVHALYWSKNGAWFEVAAEAEAAAFLDGPPPGSQAVRLDIGPDGGFAARRGRLSSRVEPLQLDAVLVCCHGGPGEDGTLQGALDLAGVRYSGPSAVSAALGMDKLASFGVVVAAGLPALPRVLLHEGAKEPEFPGPYIVKPRFGGSSIGIEVVADFPTALARLAANVHLRRGAVLEPYRPELFDLQVAARTWPELAALGDRAAPESAGRPTRSSATPTSTSAARGCPRRRASCRPPSPRASRRSCGRSRSRPRCSSASAASVGSTSSPTASPST